MDFVLIDDHILNHQHDSNHQDVGNKKKPKKQNRFQRKMSELMEEAERQKKLK